MFIIELLNPDAFSGTGSIILLELTDEDSAMRAARKIAAETGRRVTVRKEDMQIIGTISAPTPH
ncbi:MULTISPECIES: hypothetical protein [Bradyrhizobium]|uniref:hypothetical protein n=1 Tax=Bradyrhizobium TaxID=374 RepID=UPI0008421A6C|nr:MULTISPECIES: hypothetical protein [Bradyrhizobium]MCP1838386.1 hypothetical protein [Bradyrhizobium sp. USDA 4538]MCP1898950.1 hypothetical protein [Bradyrhizobium sp. USDA 4537]MCP1909444.1 hypothetical protein [Bradyrhizobium elkanii]MCP1986936.1 hypothetical protein [Bradyrhizobium sp. USDA 4539]ODM74050.1 hypothetical protein A6452_40015 [Bradyrhizobium elkanii]